MDLFCQKCLEPWDACYIGSGDFDADCKEDGIEQVNNMLPSKAFNTGIGCPSCNWGKSKNANKENTLKSQAMSLMSDILGDDIDGVASMMDDFEYLGMFDE